jgi:hypothetical protein
MKQLGEKDLLVFSPFIELILLLVYPMISLANVMGRKNKWR